MKTKTLSYILVLLAVIVIIYFVFFQKKQSSIEPGFNGEILPLIPDVYRFKMPVIFGDLVEEMGFDTSAMKNVTKVTETIKDGAAIRQELVTLTKLPPMLDLRADMADKGRKNVFPIKLRKFTDGIIELPLRMSLIQKGYPYKYMDYNQDDVITVTDLKDFTYSVDDKVFFDTFLITDKDYLIAYSAAVDNFGIDQSNKS